MQEYDIYHVQITPIQDEVRDIAIALLADAGFDNFVENETGFDAYIEAGQMDAASMDVLLSPLITNGLHIIYSSERLENRDWNEQWEQDSFRPIIIDGLCAIHRPEQQVDVQPFDILIEPRMAFGSGTHETTAQLVEYLLNQQLDGKRCLDMGCGTGILGICMAKAGAAEVVGIDIDEFSVDNSRLNANLNNTTVMNVIHGDANAIKGPFDIIVANIHKNIILHDLDVYVKSLSHGGTLLLSGFFISDVEDIEKRCKECGLAIHKILERNGWAVLVTTKI